MTYQFTGKLIKVGRVIPCTGKVKEKCTFIVKVEDDDNREIAFVLFDEKINLLEPLEIGDKVEISFSIKTREYFNNKTSTSDYTTTCYAIHIRKLEEKRGGRDRYRQREEQEQGENFWNSGGRNQNRQKTHDPHNPPPWQGAGTDWFAGCKNAEEAKKRFRKLSVEHHPDKPGGSTERQQEINKQYEKWK